MWVRCLDAASGGFSVVMTREGSSRERGRRARVSAPDQRFALLRCRCGVTPSPAIVGARRVDVAPPDDLTPTKMRWRRKWKWR